MLTRTPLTAVLLSIVDVDTHELQMYKSYKKTLPNLPKADLRSEQPLDDGDESSALALDPARYGTSDSGRSKLAVAEGIERLATDLADAEVRELKHTLVVAKKNRSGKKLPRCKLSSAHSASQQFHGGQSLV